jgi:hypothetical protein
MEKQNFPQLCIISRFWTILDQENRRGRQLILRHCHRHKFPASRMAPNEEGFDSQDIHVTNCACKIPGL